MTTLTSTRVRGPNVPEKWPPRSVENRRKTNPTSILINNWPRDGHPNAPRYSTSNNYQQTCASEHNIKFAESRSSQETLDDDNEPSVEKDNARDCTEGSNHTNASPRQSNETTLRRKQQVNGYPEFNVPEAMVAVQKLQKLKELQRRRDLTERYYSQEIRRLIGEHYFNPRLTLPQMRINERLHSTSAQSYFGDRPKPALKSLQPCGTMTTITRLDCGCVQETTRPIFTTARGRVQKKTCSDPQEEVFLKLTSSNPQEHLFSTMEQQKERSCFSKPKKRFSLDPRAYTKIPLAVNRSVNMENSERKDVQKAQTLGRSQRSMTPVRKLSETSTTSI